MNVVPLSACAEWIGDARGEDRALRVSWHVEDGLLVLSTWRAGGCVSAVRLTAAAAADLIGALATGVAALAATDRAGVALERECVS
jgi:hypothetical protein